MDPALNPAANDGKYTLEGAKDPPKVSCVMVTGKGAEHEQLARQAVNSFLGQTYPNCELVIVNDGPYRLDISHSQIHEVCLDYQEDPQQRLTLGALRNIGLDNCRGDWICQWDDDDWSHPHRIAMQMAVRRDSCCVLLRYQIRYSVTRNTAGIIDCVVGHAGTILHPARPLLHRYPEQRLSEDSVFWVNNWGDNRIVLQNGSNNYPGPALYLRLYHGKNSWDEDHVMREYAGKDNAHHWFLNTEDEEYYLEQVLPRYGISTE